MSDFNITLFETCELLNRSKKSISRYIRRGLLHPERVKSQQGTLEYRFSKADIETFKTQEALQVEQARQDRPDRPDRPDGTDQTGHQKSSSVGNEEENSQSRQDTPEQTGHERQDRNRTGTGQDSEVITLLKETTGLLKEQLTKKDEQIKDLGGKIDQLIERDRETNILIGQLQSKVLMLEKPREPINADADETGHKPEETGQDTAGETGQDKPVKKGFLERVKDFLKEK
ncbi:MAG: hypothetical protein DDT40_00667 [candidate division WS2 bacterium]|nr:hypothetical protein [Candidatus Psychracetigena formicireducens]